MKKNWLRLCCSGVVIVGLLVVPMTSAEMKGKDRKYFEERGEVVWEVPTEQKVVALTFDDGPNSVFTPQILEILRENHAKASFFVVGSRVKESPQIAKQIVSEGHELANHTYSHPDMRRLSVKQLLNEVERTEEVIEETTGQKPKLFRPPGGFYNEPTVQAMREHGFLVVMWSWHQDTRDWTDPGVGKIVNKVLKNAQKGDIILFHDHGGDRKQTVQALRQILPELTRRGYQFITVSELLKQANKINVTQHP